MGDAIHQHRIGIDVCLLPLRFQRVTARVLPRYRSRAVRGDCER